MTPLESVERSRDEQAANIAKLIARDARELDRAYAKFGTRPAPVKAVPDEDKS